MPHVLVTRLEAIFPHVSNLEFMQKENKSLFPWNSKSPQEKFHESFLAFALAPALVPYAFKALFCVRWNNPPFLVCARPRARGK